MIAMILCPIIMVAAIVFILFNLGIIGAPVQPQVVAMPPGAAGAPGGPVGVSVPGGPGGPNVPGGPAGPGNPGGPGKFAQPAGPGAPGAVATHPGTVPGKPEKVASKPGAPGKPEVPGKPGAAKPSVAKTAAGKPVPGKPGAGKPEQVAGKKVVPGKPAMVAGKPNPQPVKMASARPGGPGGPGGPGAAGAPAQKPSSIVQLPPKAPRPDPFRPYRNIALVVAASRPVLPELPRVWLARLNPNSPADVNHPNAPAFAGGDNQQGALTAQAAPPQILPVSVPWRVAGIMKGDGVKAIVVNGDQSAVVMAGDSLPDGTATVVTIGDTGVVVRTTGAVRRMVKLDANDSNLAAANPGGQPGGPPPGQPGAPN